MENLKFAILLDQMPTPDSAGLVEIPIAITGAWVRGEQKFALTRADLAAMVKNFAKRKNGELNVDYDHASEMPEVAHGGPVLSAGRILKMRSNGALYAGIKFTARALEFIRNDEYRYVSPAIDFGALDKITGEAQGTTLTSLALTNRPFLEELPAIKLSEIGVGSQELGEKPKSQILNPESSKTGGNMEGLTVTKLSPGKYQIVRGTEVLGSVEIAEPASLNPEEIIATFTEKLGAKGKTEEELKALLSQLSTFNSQQANAEAFKLLASEGVKDGKLDREKMKVLARDQKATVEQFFTFEDAWGKVDAAVKAAKVLPKSREHALRIALSDAPAFDALMADAKPIVPLQATGLAGEGVPGTTAKANPAPGIEVDPHSVKLSDRAQAIAVERKISFGEALKIARDELGPAAS